MSDLINEQNNTLNEKEKIERLKKDINKKATKRIIYGSLAIIFCYAMILGIMYGVSNGDEKTRMIVLIVFGSLLGASLLAFIIYVCFKSYFDKKYLDPEYVDKRKQKMQLRRKNRKGEK